MHKIVKVIIVIIVFCISVSIGWIAGKKIAEKEESVMKEDKKIENNEKSDEDANKYQEWMDYILKQDINSIKYYYEILDENDSNFKDNIASFYTNELSKDDLKAIFNSMNNSNIGLVMGLGGTSNYIKIDYNNNSSVTITEGSLIFIENDIELKNILSDLVKNIVSNMPDEQKELYGNNPVGNIIRDWDGTIINNYFDKENAKTYYVE